MKAINSAESLYRAIGGTASYQAFVISVGYEPHRKPKCKVNPAGTKLLRKFKEGVATVRHEGPFNLKGVK